MTALARPVATTCDRPELDASICTAIVQLVNGGLDVRTATEQVARQAADEAIAKRWRGDLVQFVVIRTADLGARIARDRGAV